MNEYAISEKPLSFLDKSPICLNERRNITFHRRSKNDWQDFPLPLDNTRKCKEINRFFGPWNPLALMTNLSSKN
jgi:hypothetical protein